MRRKRRSDGLEFLAWLEADGLARRNVHFLTGAGIAADAGLTGLDGEDAEQSEFDALSAAQGAFQGLEDGLDGVLGLGPGDAGGGDHFVDNVQLNQRSSEPAAKTEAYARHGLAGCQAAKVILRRERGFPIIPAAIPKLAHG